VGRLLVLVLVLRVGVIVVVKRRCDRARGRQRLGVIALGGRVVVRVVVVVL
jgi:hypothetical protein